MAALPEFASAGELERTHAEGAGQSASRRLAEDGV